ncbi:hypothetical protein [Microbacterium sp. NPDC058389]|uniref:hypothetical protein n=1 Tax=Microbacterium sp. NPDC058389 TaxID=3346475 RepID=UPI003664B292
MEVQQESKTAHRSGLTRPMWGALIAVGAVVLITAGAAVWLFVAPVGGPGGAGAAPHPSPAAVATQGPLPEATPTTGSEVLPPPAEDTEGGLPLPPSTATLFTGPLPASASGAADLVDGFPSDVMGPAPEATVVQNEIATEGEMVQVSLVARTQASPQEVIDHYAQLWASKGLVAAPESADGSVAYTSALDSLTLAFTPATGTGTVYMVHGVFRTN